MMSDLDEEFIVLDELVNHSSSTKTIKDPYEPYEITKEPTSLERLYQIQGIKDKIGGIIKFIGQNVVRPTIIIHEFTFKRYQCQITSYILSDIDIKVANDKCALKMLGLLIKDKGGVVAAITMSFYTFIHRKDKTDLEKYISNKDDNKILPGFYAYELKYYDRNIEKNESVGGTFESFPGKTRCVYDLINLLSNEKLSFLY